MITGQLSINTTHPGTAISPRLFGIFYEDLNHAGEGGLHAELVRNRAMNHPELLSGWTMICEGNAVGTMGPALTPEKNPVNQWSLRLQIVDAADGYVGVANDGFWGIPIRQGAQYTLTLDAWCSADFCGPLNIALESADGIIYAQVSTELLTPEKQRLTLTLTASATDAQTRLVLSADIPGTLWFDYVSLFPADTWQGHVFRRDLAEMTAALQPSFVRFPGGCYVEGDNLSQAFRWKENLGDPAQRKGHWNRWGYYTSAGLGLHEYLQLCEDLGAEALFVVNAGMSHTDTLPEDQVGALIDDVLDAIEYANGPVESHWGGLRAANGHPAPFNLKYIEVGNENGGPLYERNYRRYYEAIKAAAPEIKIVCNYKTPNCPADIVDEHYFGTADELIARAAQYDGYDRQGPKIYVGEYASAAEPALGALLGALGEAVFMIGMERNGDIVEMASFAPLFVHVMDRHWEYDAIAFDASRCCGTPSYYVQQLFSLHRCASVLPIPLSAADGIYAMAGRSANGDLIIKLVNTTAEACTVDIHLDGMTGFTGMATVLTADSPDAINTLVQPDNVVPSTTPVQVNSAMLSYTCLPYSLSILRGS